MMRGEVRWYKFGKPDKRRPVVILTRNSHIEYLNELTIAAVTTSLREIPSQVWLAESDGMPKKCAASLDHLRTVEKSKIGRLITTLNASRMMEIRAALLYALGYAG